MAAVETLPAAATARRLNVADRLTEFAGAMPDAIAVACPQRRSLHAYQAQRGPSGAEYATVTFSELDANATRVARGLAAWGVPPGTRLALLVKPGIEFVTLVFGLLRAGMVIVLVDPGLGRRNLIRCLSEVEPEGFVAIGVAQAARLLLRHKFPRARWNVTVGRRWFWGGTTLDKVLALGSTGSPNAGAPEARAEPVAPTRPDDPAAIIFTSGSTGPPKGVLYTHRMFDTQVEEIRSAYGIEPYGVDLACFPLFALFDAAMGVTTVMPQMDFSRPAAAKPTKLLTAANDWQVTQAFASPAVWRVLSDHCTKTGGRIESLRQVFSCGAPVPADVLRATLACVGKGATMHTPYGATECLPVSTIEAAEVLAETAAQTDKGAGVCVGRKIDSIDWRVIQISDDPIEAITDTVEMPRGEIGELVVRGPQVSSSYVTRREFNVQTKINNGRAGASSPPCGAEDGPARLDFAPVSQPWHRTGDVGYFDERGRFWYCGRKSQRVLTDNGSLYTERIEAVFNSLPAVRRAALVGVGKKGAQTPMIVIEPADSALVGSNTTSRWRQRELVHSWYANNPLLNELWFAEHGYTPLPEFLFHPSLPVDIRHNSKINRELLTQWAAKTLARHPRCAR